MHSFAWIFLLVAASAAVSSAQPATAGREDTAISELLSYSVPAEDWQEHLKKRKQAGWVPPPLPTLAPPDTASIDDLVSHWRTDADTGTNPGEPSAAVRERLLALCEKSPRWFEMLAGRFSSSQEGVVPRLQKLHDSLASAAAAQDEEALATLPRVRRWLMTEAGLFRDELTAEATRYFTAPDDTGLEAAFDGLLKLEPEAARQLLLRQAAAEPPLARCTALLRLHAMQNAPQGPWREGLQTLVTSRDVPATIRARALKRLGETEWPGKVEWVMLLFDDADLGLVQKGKYDKEEPLAQLVKPAPDLWVPKISSLVGNSNRTVHDNAVRCLVQFERADALRPLLPWLSDPTWALDEEHNGRRDLLYALAKVNLPESIPGLLWALDHDSEYKLMAAVSALVHYHAIQAVPALRKAIERETNLNHRKSLTEDLLQLEGVPLDEQALAVEKHTAIVATKEGREALQDEWMSSSLGGNKSIIKPEERLLVTTGLVIGESPSFQTDVLAKALIRRLIELRQVKKLDLAEALEARVSLWPTPSSTELLAERLRAGRVNARWLWHLFSVNTLPTAALGVVRDLPPNTDAVVAVLLRDETHMRRVLEGSSQEAQAMLLACARLRRASLPLDVVAHLLDSKHILCARAAERYLEAEDSPQARATLQGRFKGEARILGARMSHDPGHYSYGSLDDIQNTLRKQVLAAKGTLEIHALLSSGYWGDVGQVWVEIENEKATLVNDQGSGRHRTRALTAAELAEFRSYLSLHRIDDLPPLTLPVDDGIQYEYVHLTAEGGRRVFMNNPGTYSGGLRGHGSRFAPGQAEESDVNDSVYVCLVKLFEKLMEDKSTMKVAYRAATPIPGLKILIPLEQKRIGAVMAHHGVLMVNTGGRDDEKQRWMVAMEDVTQSQGNEQTWDGPDLSLPNGGFSKDFQSYDHLVKAPWLTATSGGHVRSAVRNKDNVPGLWLCREKQEPELIVKGSFAWPITSLDGQWIVAARMLGESWAEPNDMVRIHVATREIIPLQLAPADDFSSITRLPHSGKILVSRHRDESAPGIEPQAGPDKAEHHLLDPATGELQRVRGEFAPLHDETWRPLQPTSEPGIVWASITTLERGNIQGVALGRYDLRTFSFTKVMDVPHWHVSSMDFWVDEKTRTVFLAHGDLLSFPLPE